MRNRNPNSRNQSRAWTTLMCLTALLAFSPVFSIDAGAGTNPQLQTVEEKVIEMVKENHPCVVGINGGGSGVIVSADGLVLTAAHVVTFRGSRCLIQMPDGSELEGRKLGMNSDRDAAMVQIVSDQTWPFAEIRFEPMKASEWVVAMGHPQGFDRNRKPPVRFGRVIKPHRDSLGPLGFLMTDCTITGGDSGGPLFDLDGRVVGIHSFVSRGLFENYHVPMEVFKKDWDRMYFGERWGDLSSMDTAPDNPAEIIEKPALGIRFEENDKELPIISEVYRGSAAEESGLQPSDIILKVNDTEVASFRDVQQIVSSAGIGDEVLLTLKRDDSEKQVRVRLGRLPVFKTSPDWDGLIEEMEKGWELDQAFVSGMEKAAILAGKSTVAIYDGNRRAALGVIIDDSGYILTKASEVRDIQNIRAQLPERDFVSAVLLDDVESLDVALLKITDSDRDLYPVKLPESTPAIPGVGSFVVSPTVTEEEIIYLGVVSVDQRSVERDRGFLGVSLREMDDSVTVVGIIPDCPAQKAGIQVGDIIIEVNGDPISDVQNAIDTIGQYEPEELVAFEITRDGNPMEFEVRLGSRVNQMPIAFNMEGGRFSKIRAGFEAVIQHDSPLTPEDCGGPLVNSEGELVGLNIARSSRIRSFALPWNLIEPVLHRTDDGSWALKKPRKDIEKQLARARREFERTENKIRELESLLSDLDSE